MGQSEHPKGRGSDVKLGGIELIRRQQEGRRSMRDNHDGMLEFIDAFEKDGHYFVVIEYRSKRFQFGISQLGYKTLKKAMQLRPFDLMPGRKYRYFYAGSQRRLDNDQHSMDVRIELDRDATTIELIIPKELSANLLWFTRLEDIADAEYLEIN